MGAHFDRGIVLYKLKNYKQAEKEFRDELSASPQSASAHAMLGMTLNVMGKPQFAHEEAKESGDSRDYLLRTSILYTVQHPLFGIGMFQFPNYEGGSSVRAGITGNWHETHNAITQVSSECGVPAVIFFMMAIGTAMASVNRIYGQARREGYTEIANVCFCYMLSMIGYFTSIVFLSNAYRYYLPIMIGLAVALTVNAQKEMSRGRGSQLAPAGWMPPIAARRPLPQS